MFRGGGGDDDDDDDDDTLFSLFGVSGNWDALSDGCNFVKCV